MLRGIFGDGGAVAAPRGNERAAVANTSPAAFSGAPSLPEHQRFVSPPARYTSAPADMPSPPAAMVNFVPSSTRTSPPRSERACTPARR